MKLGTCLNETFCPCLMCIQYTFKPTRAKEIIIASLRLVHVSSVARVPWAIVSTTTSDVFPLHVLAAFHQDDEALCQHGGSRPEKGIEDRGQTCQEILSPGEPQVEPGADSS